MVLTEGKIPTEMEDILDSVIRTGLQYAEEVEVFISGGESVAAELRKKNIGLATGSRSIGIGIRTIDHGRIGSSGTNDPGAWKECLDAAVSSGKLASSQEWKGLPGTKPEIRAPLSFDPAVKPDAGTAEKYLHSLLWGAEEYPVDVMSGSADLYSGWIILANSHGARSMDQKSHVSVSLEAIAGQSTGYEFDQSVTTGIDPARVGREAAFFAYHGQGGDEIRTGSYPVILSPMAFAQLLGNVIIPAINGRNVHAGRSRLASSLGQVIAAESISIIDDPHRRNGPGSTWWDAEGVPTRRIGIIEGGVLKEFLYDLKTAYRYGKASTGSAIRAGYGGQPSIGYHNLVLEGPRDNVRDDRAIYIHDVVGAHTANPMSGDFSVEISNPSWIADGEFREPIRKAMYAGNVFELLRQIEAVGKTDREVGSMVLPEIRVADQKIVGV